MSPSGDVILVLAAGRGTRMGGPKVTMLVEGRPWWVHQAQRLAAVGLEAVWVVAPETLSAFGKHALSPRRTVPGDPSRPMMDSVVRGVEALHRDVPPPRGVFVLPVDVPVPRRGVFEALGGRIRPAIPVHQGKKGHPVYLPWPWVEASIVGRSERGEEDGAQRLDRLIEPAAEPITVRDPAVTLNLNTPEDLRGLGATLWSDPS